MDSQADAAGRTTAPDMHVQRRSEQERLQLRSGAATRRELECLIKLMIAGHKPV
jgi:hypothetical protein